MIAQVDTDTRSAAPISHGASVGWKIAPTVRLVEVSAARPAFAPPEVTIVQKQGNVAISPDGNRIAFVASDVVLLTGSLVTPDGSGFDPLLFDKQGVLHVAVFTDPARVGFHAEQAPHQIRWLMLDVLRRVPGGYGVVINPGTTLGFEISPAGVGEILKDFA